MVNDPRDSLDDDRGPEQPRAAVTETPDASDTEGHSLLAGEYARVVSNERHQEADRWARSVQARKRSKETGGDKRR